MATDLRSNLHSRSIEKRRNAPQQAGGRGVQNATPSKMLVAEVRGPAWRGQAQRLLLTAMTGLASKEDGVHLQMHCDLQSVSVETANVSNGILYHTSSDAVTRPTKPATRKTALKPLPLRSITCPLPAQYY